MKLFYTLRFQKSVTYLPLKIQSKLEKQINLLLHNIRHPSLRAKKYDEERDIWQARIDRGYRFYFLIKDNIYILLEAESHPK